MGDQFPVVLLKHDQFYFLCFVQHGATLQVFVQDKTSV